MSSTISDFYAGKNVLITGATGFVGAMLLERLLSTCPEVGTIYVLIRAKKAVEPEERVKAIFATPLFGPLKEVRGEDWLAGRLVPICGDLLQAELGISNGDKQLIQQQVNVIIHSAASVKFNEPMKPAIQLNLRATREVVKLANSCSNLDSLVHVSTAYTQVDCEGDIEERRYPVAYNYADMLTMSEWMPEEMMNTLTPKFLGEKPNTYTFTKHLAEELVCEESRVPTAIMRPSIICASAESPFPGWIDNFNCYSGMVMGNMTGVLRIALVDESKKANIVPVDYVANQLIAAGWYIGTAKPAEVGLYNCGSDGFNITWRDLNQAGRAAVAKNPSEKAIRSTGTLVTKSPFIYNTLAGLFHTMPGHLMDIPLRLTGKRPRVARMMNTVNASLGVVDFFSLNEWTWTQNNMANIAALMTQEDRKTFKWRDTDFDLKQYMLDYASGCRTYVFKEPEEPTKGFAVAKQTERVKVMTNFASYGIASYAAYKSLQHNNYTGLAAYGLCLVTNLML